MDGSDKYNNVPVPAGAASGGTVLIEEHEVPSGFVWERTVDHDKVIFIIKGGILLTYLDFEERKVGPGEMFILPKNAVYKIHTATDVRMIVFFISLGTHISDLFPLLPAEYIDNVRNCVFYPLPIEKTLEDFLNTTITCIEGGVEVVNYYEFKFRELLVLMRRFYTPEELAMLFCPVLKSDSGFIDFVLENYGKVKTVNELAEMSHYSLSAFNKHFREAFGQPPYAWMKHQKAMKLFNRIKNSDDTMQQISDDFGFSSLSQMTNFCKVNFQCTPTQIRQDRDMSSIKTDKSDKKAKIVK